MVDGLEFEALAPLPPRRDGGVDGARGLEQRLGEITPQFICRETRRLSHDGFDFGWQQCLVTALEDEARDELDAAACGFAGRHAEGDEVFGVHGLCAVKLADWRGGENPFGVSLFEVQTPNRR